MIDRVLKELKFRKMLNDTSKWCAVEYTSRGYNITDVPSVNVRDGKFSITIEKKGFLSHSITIVNYGKHTLYKDIKFNLLFNYRYNQIINDIKKRYNDSKFERYMEKVPTSMKRDNTIDDLLKN